MNLKNDQASARHFSRILTAMGSENLAPQDCEHFVVGSKLRVNNAYLFLAALALSLWVFWANVGVFVDDVYIYLRVVNNVVKGIGPVLNPGDSHFAVTSPLWTFLLSWAGQALGFLDLVTLSKLEYMVFLSLASAFAFLTLRKRAGSWAILSPLLIFFNLGSVTFAGGEVALAYCALLGTLWAYYVKRHLAITGLFVGLAYLARSELVLLLVPIGIHYLLVCKKDGTTLRSIAAEVGQATAAFLAVVLVWHIYYAMRFHALFPDTLRAKVIQGKSGIWPPYSLTNALTQIRTALGGKYYLVPFVVVGLIYFRGVSLTFLIYAALHCGAYKLLSVPDYHWYYYDLHLLISTFTVFGCIAFFFLLRKWIDGIASPDTTLENINNLDYFVSTYAPRFIVFPEMEQTPHEAFLFKGDLALYKNDYVAYPEGHRQASVFSRDQEFPDVWPVSPPLLPCADSLSLFLELSKNTVSSSDVRLVPLNGTYVLNAHPPFASSVRVPEGTRGLSVAFGYLPSVFQQEKDGAITDGATFKIYGVKAGSRKLLFRRDLLPYVVEAHRKEQEALIKFPPGEYESLELGIDPNENSFYDWTYWGDVHFLRE